MKTIRRVERLTRDDRGAMEALADCCSKADGVAYPLDLGEDGHPRGLPAALLMEEKGKLTGFLHLFDAPVGPPELIGFVHPDHRRRGVFRQLYEEALDVLNGESHLLVTVRGGPGGAAFARAKGMEKRHSEYRMVLQPDSADRKPLPTTGVRVAAAADAAPLARLACSCYGLDAPDRERRHLETLLKAENRTVLVYETADRIPAGMAVLYEEPEDAGIFGVCVSEAHRRRGIGSRLIAAAAALALRRKPDRPVYLEVETENEKALSIYKRRGFEATAVMDYYEAAGGQGKREGEDHDV